jgi:hypothetical protein
MPKKEKNFFSSSRTQIGQQKAKNVEARAQNVEAKACPSLGECAQ